MAQTTTRPGRNPHREFLGELADLTRGPAAGSREVELGQSPAAAQSAKRAAAVGPEADAECRTGTATQRIGGRPWDKPPTLGATIPIDKLNGGTAEIKPHVSRAMGQGLEQLRKGQPDGQRFLITYRPVGIRPDGRAAAVCVYALGFTNIADVPRDVAALRARTWAHLGRAPLPERIPFPTVVDGGFFGSAVERHVRKRFGTALVRPAGRTVRPGTGGHLPGPDVRYEQAEFYAELARELGDPMLAELAAEMLHGPTRPEQATMRRRT